MLDTLQAASLAGLTGTSLALMAPALHQAAAPGLGGGSQPSVAVTAVSLVAAGALNLGVLAAFFYALALEGHRALLLAFDKDGKGRVTWADVRAGLRAMWAERFRRGGGEGGGAGPGGAARQAATVTAPSVAAPPGPPREFIRKSAEEKARLSRESGPKEPPPA